MVMAVSLAFAVDNGVFLIANLSNLLLAVMFWLRAKGRPGEGRFVGGLSLALLVPLAGAAGYNLLAQRPWWAIVLPLPMLIYDGVELVFDYIFKLNFRQTVWLGPYLALYYLGLMMLIGYSFLIGRAYGFVTLATYFLNLGATFYAYKRVGHG